MKKRLGCAGVVLLAAGVSVGAILPTLHFDARPARPVVFAILGFGVVLSLVALLLPSSR
jgi:hypothetical protein